ncbi:MAG: DUF4097 family beta strand repeat-containing protein [Acidimicrobiales bacterium]
MEMSYAEKGPSFETPGPVRLRVDNPAGRVAVTTWDRPVTEVELTALDPGAEDLVDETRMEAHQLGEVFEVTIHVPRRSGLRARHSEVGVAVRIPHGLDLGVETASADVEAGGRYARVEVKTASGDVAVDRVEGEARLRTASGDIRLAEAAGQLRGQSASGDQWYDRIGGQAEVESASGDIRAGRAGQRLEVRAASGDVRVGTALSDLSVRTASGDQRIDCATEGEVGLQSVAGDIAVAIARGTTLAVDAQSMTGDTSSEIPLSDTPGGEGGPGSGSGDGEDRFLALRARTVSGDISIRRAPGEGSS